MHFVVMNNVNAALYRMGGGSLENLTNTTNMQAQSFDLKGSWVSRRAGSASGTQKDSDLDQAVTISKDHYDCLLSQIDLDTRCLLPLLCLYVSSACSCNALKTDSSCRLQMACRQGHHGLFSTCHNCSAITVTHWIHSSVECCTFLLSHSHAESTAHANVHTSQPRWQKTIQ